MDIQEKLKTLNKISFRGPIGLFVIVAGFAFLFILLYRRAPTENKDIIMFCAGFVLAIMKDVAGWYFGSSKDKADQDKADQVNTLIQTAATNEKKE